MKMLFTLLFFISLTSKLLSQESDQNGWKVFMDDNLILAGNIHLRNYERSKAAIGLSEWRNMKILKFIYFNHGAYEVRIEFKEKGKLVFDILKCNSERIAIGDTITVYSEIFSKQCCKIDGKEVEIYYNDDKFQMTPTLLGTIHIKKE